MHLAPYDRMTWQMWTWVCHGLQQFMKDFEYVELAFDVVFNPFGIIAQGVIEVKSFGPWKRLG